MMRWLPSFIALLLLCTACTRKDPEPQPANPPSDPGARTQEATTEPDEAPPRADPQLELLEAGSKPRAALRWTPAAGGSQDVQIGTTTALSGTVGGLLAVEKPPQQMKWNLTVTTGQVAADGTTKPTLRLNWIEVLQPGLSKKIADVVIKQAVEDLAEAKGSYSMDDLGIQGGLSIESPEEGTVHTFALYDALQKALEAIVARAPEEPIGIGAKWKVIRELVRDGATVTQTSVVTLTKLENQVATFAVEQSSEAAPQDFLVRGMGGEVYRLMVMRAAGKAEVTWDLREAFPTSASVEDEMIQFIKHGNGTTEKTIRYSATIGGQ